MTGQNLKKIITGLNLLYAKKEEEICPTYVPKQVKA